MAFNPHCVGSIDQGTSSTRFILFDLSGSIIDEEQIEISQVHFDSPDRNGWAEHSPTEILQSVERCIELVMKRNPTAVVSSVGLTNQRESCLVWDRLTGSPLFNSLVWHDSRTSTLVKEFTEKFGSVDHFRDSCGLPISTYFSALKLVWLLKNIPAVSESVAAGRAMFGTIDSWIIWNLTGGKNGGIHVTDVTNASRTMLMNLKSARWDVSTCRALGIPIEILPQIRSSSEVYGKFSDGLLKDVPIAGCLGDQQAALFGQLCLNAGQAKNTYGTGCFLLMNTGTEPVKSTHGLLTTAAFQLGPNQPLYYALEGSIAVAGSAIRWLRDEIHLIEDYSDLGKFVDSVKDNGDCYLVPAFSGLLSPHWRTDARGLIAGLTHSTNRGHIIRAALESSAYQTRDVLAAMEADSGVKLTSLHVDGGLCQSEFLMQFQSDLLDLPVVKPSMLECTAAGAAFAAGLAVGAWQSIEDIKEKTKKNRAFVYEPRMDQQTRENIYKNWKKAVKKSFDWVENNPPHAKVEATKILPQTKLHPQPQPSSDSSFARSILLLATGFAVGALASIAVFKKRS